MDSVVYEGKEYTKASVLAEKFRYTQDYLGQLCRGKKVDARLVGRAWYINLESLMSHKDSRYKNTSAASGAEKTAKKSINNYLSRIDVEPILQKKTVKIFKSNNGMVSELPVKYEADDYALIPRVYKEAVSVSLPVDPADAESLKVRKVEKQDEVSFVPDELPEVYLRGTISVAGIPEPSESVADIIEKTEVKTEEESKLKSQPKIVRIRKPLPRPAQGTHLRNAEVKMESQPKMVTVRPLNTTPAIARPLTDIKPPHHTQSATVPVIKEMVDVAAKPSIVPVVPPVQLKEKAPATKIANTNTAQFTPTLVVQKNQVTEQKSSFLSVVVPVGVVGIALVSALLITATNLEILANGTSYSSRLVIQSANLFALYHQLPW
ncbi:MAG TPA: hypothetical protein VGE31_01570 [Candidatus Paceibacterota bacterium]